VTVWGAGEEGVDFLDTITRFQLSEKQTIIAIPLCTRQKPPARAPKNRRKILLDTPRLPC
jgi:hypothetical protein